MNVEKDVVLDEGKRKEKFEKLLTKISMDFKINNSTVVVRRFLEDRKK